ncbi:MAG: hypothetical protein ABIN45_01695 [Gammaproteobacteria bacterium]
MFTITNPSAEVTRFAYAPVDDVMGNQASDSAPKHTYNASGRLTPVLGK